MGRNGNAVPDMGGGHMSESLYDFCRKYDRQYLLEEWDSEKNLPLMPVRMRPFLAGTGLYPCRRKRLSLLRR